MRKLYIVLALLSCMSISKAETLESALVKVYETNPRLNSYRKNVMAQDEIVPQALSGWRPNISAGASVGHSEIDDANSDSKSNFSKSMDVSISQPLYKGGSTISSTESAKNTVKANHEGLRQFENEILLSGVKAYVDVIMDKAILNLNIRNKEVLEKNLEATKARFDAGELTITDVSQSEAGLSDAEAKVASSESNFNISMSNYKNIVGVYPVDLKKPEETFAIPKNKEDLLNLAFINNPEIQISIYNDKAANEDITTAYASVLPEIDLVGKIGKSYDPSDGIDSSRSHSISAQLRIPLYKSGAATSKIRQAKHKANQKRIDVITKKREVEAAVINAWENYESNKFNIKAREDQIKANKIALEGVEQEELVGARTVLDVLDAERDLLNSNVQLVRAERDKIYSYYFLISKIGLLTAKDLSLPVAYFNANENYERVKNKWWGLE